MRHSAYLRWRKHLDVSVVEVTRALDGLEADGVVPPASSAGTNPGEHGRARTTPHDDAARGGRCRLMIERAEGQVLRKWEQR